MCPELPCFSFERERQGQPAMCGAGLWRCRPHDHDLDAPVRLSPDERLVRGDRLFVPHRPRLHASRVESTGYEGIAHGLCARIRERITLVRARGRIGVTLDHDVVVRLR
jgi:hypothetical protein